MRVNSCPGGGSRAAAAGGGDSERSGRLRDSSCGREGERASPVSVAGSGERKREREDGGGGDRYID